MATKWLTHGILGDTGYPLGWLFIPPSGGIITSLGYIPYRLGTHGLTYTYIYIYTCMQRMEFQARSPATAVQLLLHVQDSAENACSVRTGYVFFGTLVIIT